MKRSTTSAPRLKLSFEAIGTVWDISLQTNRATAERVADAISNRIWVFNKTYSRFRADSVVTSMSKKAGVYTLPNDAERLLTFYRQMYNATEGRVTPLIGGSLSDIGYDAEYSLQAHDTIRTPAKWEDAIDFRAPALRIKQPSLLDFGAAGKGYLVDLVAEVIQSHKIKSYVIDAGGDMRVCSDQPVRVGLEHPNDPSQAIGIVELGNYSLCGSAGNRRAWNGYNHILDPTTLKSPDHIAAVWASSESTLVADGMTTCLYFADPATLRQKFEFEYVIAYADGSIVASDGFAGEIFT